MPVVSPDLILLQAQWDLLEASDDFKGLVKVGNRIKENLKMGEGVRFNPESRPSKNTGDVPEVEIDIGSFTMKPVMETFGNCTRIEEHRQLFVYTITVDDLGVNTAFQVKAAMLSALRAGKANFGIPKSTLIVLSWDIPTAESNKDKPAFQTGGRERREIKVTIGVDYRLRT